MPVLQNPWIRTDTWATFLSRTQIVDIIVFTTRPGTNLHFLFALVSSLLCFRARGQRVLISFFFTASRQDLHVSLLCSVFVHREHRNSDRPFIVTGIGIRSWWYVQRPLYIHRTARSLRFSFFQTLNARAGLREEMRTTRFNGVELPVRDQFLGTERLTR